MPRFPSKKKVEKLLDFEAFALWADSFDGDAIVGESKRDRECPIAKFATNYVAGNFEVSVCSDVICLVHIPTYRSCSYPLPSWAIRAVHLVDDWTIGTTLINGKEIKEIVAEVRQSL